MASTSQLKRIYDIFHPTLLRLGKLFSISSRSLKGTELKALERIMEFAGIVLPFGGSESLDYRIAEHYKEVTKLKGFEVDASNRSLLQRKNTYIKYLLDNELHKPKQVSDQSQYELAVGTLSTLGLLIVAPPVYSDLIYWGNTDYTITKGDDDVYRMKDHTGNERPVQRGKGYQGDGIAHVKILGVNALLDSNAGRIKFQYLSSDPNEAGMSQILFTNEGTSSALIITGSSTGSLINESLRFIVFDNGTPTLNFAITMGHVWLNDGIIHDIELITGDGDNRFLVDGVKYSQTFAHGSSTSNIFLPITTTNVAYLLTGSSGGTPANQSTAMIGNIEIYNASDALVYRANCDESEGSIAYDSSGNDNHGTITLADLNTFHAEDDNFDSRQNEVGYTEDTVVVDRLLPIRPDGLDINGETPTYEGKVQYPLTVKGVNYILGDGVANITFSAYLTKTITYFDGTIDQTDTTDGAGNWIVPNTITVSNIRIEESVYYCDEGNGTTVYDSSANGNHGTIADADLTLFWAKDTTGKLRPNRMYEPFSVIGDDGDHTYIPHVADNIDAQGNPCTDVIGVYNTGYTLTAPQAPAIFTNDPAKLWTGEILANDGNFDMILSEWDSQGNGTLSEIFISEFNKKAIKSANTGTSVSMVADAVTIANDTEYYVSFMYRTSDTFNVNTNTAGGGTSITTLNMNLENAKFFETTFTTGSATTDLHIGFETNTGTDPWVEISEVCFSPVADQDVVAVEIDKITRNRDLQTFSGIQNIIIYDEPKADQELAAIGRLVNLPIPPLAQFGEEGWSEDEEWYENQGWY